MARLIGPDESCRVVYLPDGTARAQAAAAPLYLDAAATTPADVLTLAGAVIPASTVYVDAYSKIPLVQYPDGVDVLYTVVNGGPASPLYARADDRIDALTVRVADVEAGGGVDEAALLHKATSETITGVKTFSVSPLVPTPTTSGQASPKSYVDSADQTLSDALDDVVAGLVTPSLEQAGAGVTAALTRAVSSVCMMNLGDSTGDATGEWLGLLGQRLGVEHPAYTVLWRKWNDATQAYDLPVTMQSGTTGIARYVTMASGKMEYTGTSITGDLEVIQKVRPASWAPGGAAATRTLSSRYGSAGQRSWYFWLDENGKLNLTWGTDGTNLPNSAQATVAVPFTDGTDGWVRVRLDVDNGATGRTIQFHTSTDGVTWTQLGTDIVQAGVTSLFNSSTAYTLGARGSGVGDSYCDGRYYWTQINTGFGGGGVVPPLADDWDQITTGNSMSFGGDPVLMLLCGSQSGQNISYLNDSTRRVKLGAPHGQQIILLNTGHNEGNTVNQAWITVYSQWVSDLKTRIPRAPIVVMAQNPTAIGSYISTPHGVDTQTRHGPLLLAWAATQAGCYPLDAWPAFDDLATQLDPDGVHPTPAGHQVWADLIYKKIFRVQPEGALTPEEADFDERLDTLESTITTKAAKGSNLSDLGDAAAARTSLGLGGSATRAVGTTAGTVAAGDDRRVQRLLASNTAGFTAVSNTTADTDLASLSIPAGAIADGDFLVFECGGTLLNNSGGAVNHTFRFKVGATTVLTTAAIALGTNAGDREFHFRAVIAFPTSATQKVSAEFNFSLADTLTWGGGSAPPTGYGTAAEATTGAVAVALSLQPGTASALSVVQAQWALLTRL